MVGQVTINAIHRRMQDSGNPHVRFDEGKAVSTRPRRGLLLDKIRTLIAAAILSMVAFGLHARTVYVKVGLPDYAGHDGSSWEMAYEKIQEGVDAARADDVVLVGPGDYRVGGRPDGFSPAHQSRIVITNAITLRADQGSAATRVFGGFDDDNPYAGLPHVGPKAVRCITVSGGAAAIIEGFSFLNGACGYVAPDSGNPEDGSLHSAGGALVWASGSSNRKATFVDCVFGNCHAVRGGAVRGGLYVRCRFIGNQANVNCAVARESQFFNCLFAFNGTSPAQPALGYCPGIAQVNCTFVGNGHSPDTANSGDFYNTLFTENGNGIGGGSTYHNCVLSAGEAKPNETCIVPTDNFQLFAPAVNDLRLASTSVAVGSGDPDALQHIPEAYRDLDIDGNSRTAKDGSVNVGCSQTTATPAGGAVVFKDAVTVNGVTGTVKKLHAFTESYPDWLVVEVPDNANGMPALYLKGDGGIDNVNRRYPQLKDGRIYVLPPPTGKSFDLAATWAEKVVWADANYKGGDSDGSERKPFVKLQDAVGAAGSNAALIRVRKGLYDQGGASGSGLMSRVNISSGKDVRIVAEDGPAETVIVGESATAAGGADAYGCGSDAVRCVTMNSASALQGFTLTGGRTGQGTSSDDCSFGGALRAGSVQAYLTDSVITNCFGQRGGAAYQGTLQRCLIVDNKETVGGGCVVRQGRYSSCVFRNNSVGGSTYEMRYGGTVICHCTMESSGLSGNPYATGPETLALNCVFSDYVGADGADGCCGNFFWNANRTESAIATTADPCFVSNPDDLRLLSHSTLIGGGVTTHADYYLYATTDIKGRPIRFFPDGSTVAGAYQQHVVQVVAGPGVSPTGTFAAGEAGESVTLTATDVRTRPFLGLSTNGTVVASTSVTYVVPEETYTPLQVEAAYGTNWFVSAVGGSDSNWGSYPDCPRQTLEGVLTNAVSGDAVHAAAGCYEVGKMQAGDGAFSRAVVPSGVTLVGEAGAGATFICGAPATGPDADEYGCGEGAVRCVVLRGGATIRGFTLTGGRTKDDASDSDAARGGGVYAGGDSSRVLDCIITNCVAARGGAGFFGTYVNVKIVDNRALRNGAAVRNGSIYNCQVAGNAGPFVGLYQMSAIHGCTLGPGNVSTVSGGAGVTLAAGNLGILNTLIVDAAPYILDAGSFSISNSVMPDYVSFSKDSAVTNACLKLPFEQLKVDSEGRPMFGSPAIDFGWHDAAYLASVENHDLAGNGRIANRRLDVGCYEYDWKPRYGADLGRRTTVTAADGNVRETDARAVELVDGCTLDCTAVSREGSDAPFSIRVRLAGAGVLTVTKDGEPWRMVTELDVTQLTFACGFGSAELGFSYAGTGTAELLRVAQQTGMMLILR